MNPHSYASPRQSAHATVPLNDFTETPGHPMMHSPMGGYDQQQAHFYNPHMSPTPGYGVDPRLTLSTVDGNNQVQTMQNEIASLHQTIATLGTANKKLNKENADTRIRLDSTRTALKDSRDSLEKVQTVLQSLIRN